MCHIKSVFYWLPVYLRSACSTSVSLMTCKTEFKITILFACREFELSWFDLDARDAKDRMRTTRSKAKARHSVGSSGKF